MAQFKISDDLRKSLPLISQRFSQMAGNCAILHMIGEFGDVSTISNNSASVILCLIMMHRESLSKLLTTHLIDPVKSPTLCCRDY